jgi:hypothetical protein
MGAIAVAPRFAQRQRSLIDMPGNCVVHRRDVGLRLHSGTSTASWTQKTSGATASGTLTVKEGASSVTLTLVGSYTSGNFTVAADGSGGTLVTDPPVPGAVVSSAATSSSMADTVPASTASVISGGYQLGAGSGADTDSGGTGVFFSGGGTVQLDALLSQFAGVISGFDLGSEVDLRSLGFGPSSGAASWTPQTGGNGSAGVEAAGHNFNLTLLGQYAANLGARADGHGGGVITDPAASGSVAPTPLVVPHSLWELR